MPSSKRRKCPVGDKERYAEQRVQSFELRKTGMQYRQIGKALGINGSTAFRHVKAVMAEFGAEEQVLREEQRQLEDRRLDALLMAVWTMAMKGDDRSVQSALRIMHRRAALWGLDEPTRIAPVTPEGEALFTVEGLRRLVSGVRDPR